MLNTNLQPHVNRYANAVFTIFAFDFLLVCTFLHHIGPKQICVNLIFRGVRYSKKNTDPLRSKIGLENYHYRTPP